MLRSLGDGDGWCAFIEARVIGGMNAKRRLKLQNVTSKMPELRRCYTAPRACAECAQQNTNQLQFTTGIML